MACYSKKYMVLNSLACLMLTDKFEISLYYSIPDGTYPIIHE